MGKRSTTMALRNPNKPHIKFINGFWIPEYSYAADNPLVPQRNQMAWAFCTNYLTGKQMVKALEARGCYKL